MGDPVEPRDVGVELRLPVVGLDLRGERVEGEAEPLDERLRDPRPIGVGDGDGVGGIGAGRPVDLAEVLRRRDPVVLAVEPVDDHCDLLAHGRRRRGLSVGVGEHGDVGELERHRRERVDEGGRAGQPHGLHRILDAHGVGQVVDVLRGAAEVDELGQVLGADVAQRLLDRVLDGLDVVDGDGLEHRELGDRLLVEAGDDRPQMGALLVEERAGARHHAGIGQMDEPFDLDMDPIAIEGGLGQVVDERSGIRPIAAVEGSEGDGRIELGESHASHAHIFARASRRWEGSPAGAPEGDRGGEPERAVGCDGAR